MNVDQLVREECPVVFVSESEFEIQYMRRMFPDVPVIEQDPTSELALADANVLNARTVVAALQSDVANLKSFQSTKSKEVCL